MAWPGADRLFPLVLLPPSAVAAALVWPFGGWSQLSGCSGGAVVEAVPWGNTAIGWAPVLLRLALLGGPYRLVRVTVLLRLVHRLTATSSRACVLLQQP